MKQVIDTWRDDWLRRFFEQDIYSPKIPADLKGRLFRKLQIIADSTSEADLRVPPANHFERLSGKLDGCRSIRVNQQWRLIFKWENGAARDLYLDDHSYR